MHNLINDNNEEINNFQNAIKTKQEKIEAYYALKIFDEYTEKQAKKEFFEQKKNSILFIQEHRCLPKIKSLLEQKAEKKGSSYKYINRRRGYKQTFIKFLGRQNQATPPQKQLSNIKKKT